MKFHENVQLDKAGRILHLPRLRQPAGRASATLPVISDPSPPCSGAGLAAQVLRHDLNLLSSVFLPAPAARACSRQGSTARGSVRLGGRRSCGNTSNGTPKSSRAGGCCQAAVTKGRCNTRG